MPVSVYIKTLVIKHFSTKALFLFCLVVITATGFPVQAQGPGYNVAVTYPINEDSVQSGDIIGRNRRTGNLRFTRVPNSREMFGVAVGTPAIVFQTGEEGGYPVLRSGQTEVNVTLAGGEIQAGDPITSSYVPGYGRRAGPDDTYQLGIALEPFTGEGATTTVNAGEEGDNEVLSGSILVDIAIEPINPEPSKEVPVAGFLSDVDLLLITKFLVAGFVAVGSIYSSFRYFGSSLSAGVSSVGRNPMAKRAIRRIVFMNIVAIVSISLAGLALSVFILFIPFD